MSRIVFTSTELVVYIIFSIVNVMMITLPCSFTSRWVKTSRTQVSFETLKECENSECSIPDLIFLSEIQYY